jgi:hypothetical protein
MELFEDALERVRRRFLFLVAGYVVMPEPVEGCLAFEHLGGNG